MATQRDVMMERTRMIDREIMPRLSGDGKQDLPLILSDLSLPELHLLLLFMKREVSKRDFQRFKSSNLHIVAGMMGLIA